jgi:threonine/homoserine/homoserine lactone efflux protein
MSFDTLLLFVPACFALNMAFGPNNLVSITIGARHGVYAAVRAASGRLIAFVIMIAVAALGMGALLTTSEAAFIIVKLLGATYLIWIGVKLLTARTDLPSQYPNVGINGGREFMRQEFLVAIGNPKAILIFTAFFPQFVSPENYWGSFLILGMIFLALELVAIAVYAFAGTRLSGVIHNAKGLRWINRISGGTMIFFGSLLAVAKRPTA